VKSRILILLWVAAASALGSANPLLLIDSQRVEHISRLLSEVQDLRNVCPAWLMRDSRRWGERVLNELNEYRFYSASALRAPDIGELLRLGGRVMESTYPSYLVGTRAADSRSEWLVRVNRNRGIADECSSRFGWRWRLVAQFLRRSFDTVFAHIAGVRAAARRFYGDFDAAEE
jgi:hypothetical protein